VYIPELGEQLPRRGNLFSKWLGRMLLRLCRWRIEGEIYPSPKLICVMGPHTSWWDFTNNLGVLLATGIHASWFIANKYTQGVAGKILAYLGAVPVERSQRTDMVTLMANQFMTRDKLVLAIFPEGTRKPVTAWKTGFWHIAKKADVAVQLIAVDYAKRATIFGPVITLSDDMDEDIRHMRAYFRTITARRAEWAIYSD
jgi:1-acyl-sn-glycerol-3-phosphate acyltransferase